MPNASDIGAGDVTPLVVLLLIAEAGATVRLGGDDLVVRGAPLCPELRDAIRRHRDAILAAFRAEARA